MLNMNTFVSELIPKLREIYNNKNADNIKAIILYGSVARGTATEESDIDIAVILDGYTEKMHDAMVEAVVDLELEYGKVISVLLIDTKQYNTWGHVSPFFKNVKKDGITLWKAA